MMGTEDDSWILPFEKRGHSGSVDQNFLWKRDNIYVMDNHRAALWCWLQHIDPKSQHAIFHIDRHTDTLQSCLGDWLKYLPSSWDLSFEEYSHLSCPTDSQMKDDRIPLFRWDNYLSIYLATFGTNVDPCYFATHGDGDKPNHHQVMDVDIWEIPESLSYWLDPKQAPWILNIDLDYFFWRGDEGGEDRRIVSDEYLDGFAEKVLKRIRDQTIAVTTICLTPVDDLTGGWRPSERLMEDLLSRLGIAFKLPRDK